MSLRGAMFWFFRSRVGRWFHDEVVARPAGYHGRCPICSWFARDLVGRWPAYPAYLRQSLRDAAEGRTFDWRDSGLPPRPSASWRPDDLIQPDGWFHDGRRWRLKRDGGWAPRSDGLWCYTRPGHVGWTQRADGSWWYDHRLTAVLRERRP